MGDGTARRKGTRQQTVGQNKERMESPAGPSGEEGSGNGGGKHGHGFVGNGNPQQPLGTGFPLTWPVHKRTRRKKRAPVAAPDRQPAASQPAGISRSAAGAFGAPRPEEPGRTAPLPPPRGPNPTDAAVRSSARAPRPPRSDPPRSSAPSAPRHRAGRLRLVTVPESRPALRLGDPRRPLSPRALRSDPALSVCQAPRRGGSRPLAPPSNVPAVAPGS